MSFANVIRMIPAFALLVACAPVAPASESSLMSNLQASLDYVVVLTRGESKTIEPESLTIELVDIADSRCPPGVSCIWAGHAAVTLKLSKPGWQPATLSIGTEAPPAMKLPYDARYGCYALHLQALASDEPHPGSKQVSVPHATIRITHGGTDAEHQQSPCADAPGEIESNDR